eukprot:1352451-Amphidinium_carterae.1
MDREGDHLVRTWSVQVHAGLGDNVIITVDASPFGMGGVLQVNGQYIAFFGVPLSDDDVQIHGYDRGSPDGQQVWELLSALIALRLWSTVWIHGRTILQGDNLAALYAILNLNPASANLRRLARELALDFAAVARAPDVVRHLPGTLNTLADALSR